MTTIRRTSHPQRTWRTILGWGLLLWILAAAVTYTTANILLVPTLVLLGSFLIPITYVTWAYEHARTDQITTPLLFRTFTIGGILGVLAASLAETYLLHPSWWMYLGVGLIEEAAKLTALAFCAHHLRTRTPRTGAVLGATVGLGFAAFETAGYALVASLTLHGLSLTDLVTTELLRGLLTPLGHGVWTAITGALLFAATTHTPTTTRFTPTGRLAAGFLAVAVLHGVWDSMDTIAIMITYGLTGRTWQYRLLELGYLPQPTPDQATLYAILNWTGLAAVALIGLLALARLLRPQAPAHV